MSIVSIQEQLLVFRWRNDNRVEEMKGGNYSDFKERFLGGFLQGQHILGRLKLVSMMKKSATSIVNGHSYVYFTRDEVESTEATI